MRVLCCLVLLLVTTTLAAAEDAPLKQTGRIPLPGVTGRIDHMAVDRDTKRLFVCALGNNSVEVVDLSAGKRVHSIIGLDEPQDVIFLPDSNRLVVASGGDGTYRVFDGGSLEPIGQVEFHDDADNLRRDPVTHRIYVGYGNGAIGMVDDELHRIGDIPLPGHPESFQIEAGSQRMFVNVPTARQVVVVDLKRQTAVDSWTLPEAEANFPMAVDETNHLVWIGCRRPAKLLGLDTRSGRVIVELPIAGDPDDIFIDGKRHRLYISCGAGFIDVLAPTAALTYRSIAQIPTALGARTSLLVPELEQLFLAVPQRDQQEAEIRVYALH